MLRRVDAHNRRTIVTSRRKVPEVEQHLEELWLLSEANFDVSMAVSIPTSLRLSPFHLAAKLLQHSESHLFVQQRAATPGQRRRHNFI
jgi:hypothetical protein